MTETPTWEDLPPPADLPGETEQPPEDTVPEDAPICPVCDKPIARDPSWHRMHKYHDECQPHVSHKSTGEKRVRTGGKAEKEADRCEQILRSFMVKTALAVSVADRYDAACIMMNAPAVCSSFRATCIRYPELRKEFLRVPEGGSIYGLIFALILMAAPMAAHHGLIPGKKIAPFLANLPFALYRLQARLGEGEAGLKSLMEEQIEELRKARDEAKARVNANGQPIPAS